MLEPSSFRSDASTSPLIYVRPKRGNHDIYEASKLSWHVCSGQEADDGATVLLCGSCSVVGLRWWAWRLLRVLVVGSCSSSCLRMHS